MKAEDKLEEASYFLKKLRNRMEAMDSDIENVLELENEFKFNLSAFIQAWRSVFDVLLYDYAEKYFKHSPERKFKIFPYDFKKIAEVLENRDCPVSMKFFKWYKEKENILRKKFPWLWHLRVFIVHRGGSRMEPRHKDRYVLKKPRPRFEVYVPPSVTSGSIYTLESIPVYFGEDVKVETEKELVIAEMRATVILMKCEKGYSLMQKILVEARESFK